MKKWLFAGAIFVLLSVQSAKAELLASESFSTGQTTGDYTNDKALSDALNKPVVVGNVGFGTNDWHFGTSFHKTRNDLSALDKMTNAAVAASSPAGIAFVTVGTGTLERKSNRKLDETPSGSSTYYFSGLVMRPSTTCMDVGEEMVIGFGPHITSHDFNTAEGIYIGLYRSDASTYKVTAYAGGNRYELQDANWQQAYHVLLKLDVDVGGSETLNAWVTPPSQTTLIQRLTDASVESYNSVGDLESLTIMSRDLGGDGNNSGVYFDEIRLGTAFADVTELGASPLAGQIASESFSVGNTSGDYVNNVNFDATENQSVVSGNAGFLSHIWENGTSLVRPRDFDSLSHTGLIGSAASGFVFFNAAEAGTDRNIKRGMDDVPVTTAYYMSGLAKYDGVGNFNDGTAMSMGVGEDTSSNTTFPIDKGVHFGMYQESGTPYLGVFAGSNTYQLAAATEDVTYQIIVSVEVDAGGQEILSAWYAADGDAAPVKALENIAVETYGSSSDLQYFLLGVKGAEDGSASGGELDEFRFGTVASAVTAYQILEPPTEMGEISIEVVGADAVISWQGSDLLTYTLQGRDLLNGGSWSNLVPGIGGFTGTMSATNSTLEDSMKFYRVIAE